MKISPKKPSISIDQELAKALQYHQAGQLNKAEEIYKRIIEVNPNHSESLHLLGVIASQAGKKDIAVKLINKAIQHNPGNSIYYYNLGNVLKEQDNLTEAVSSFQKALEINPNYTKAYNNMGTIFTKQGRFDEATSCFQKVLEINPNHAGANNNMANMLMDQHKPAEAIYYYQKALEINPDLAEAYHNLGNALKDQNRLTEALSSYQKALEINPDYAEAFSMLFHQFQRTCDWPRLKDMTARLDNFTLKALDSGVKTTEEPFANIMRCIDLPRHLAIARSWSRDIAKRMSSLKTHFHFDGRQLSKNKIIVGYLSNNFRDHALGQLILNLFGLHNRDEFEIICYSYGEDDGSHIRTQIEQNCDKFVDLINLSHADAARCIYEDQVDILVDLKGHTKGSRLEISAFRPTPVQARYLGLAGTTGADFFDYIITDRIVTPDDHAQYYSENFVYLPHCYQVNSYSQVTMNKDRKKSDFGLSEDSLVFCSFNQGCKIQPVMFNTWMNILRQVPKSVLWLQRENEITEKNLGREAESKGIKSTRLIFLEKLPKDQHLERLRLADVALDTQIVNGAATTSDALWAGAPVITLQGSSFASRMSSSILTAIGFPELITQTIGEYEQIAVDLGRNPERLQEIRQKIAKNRLVEPLFDTPRFARNLEKAYKEMWEIFVAGELPRRIEVVED
jgi:protein O-GlcNAc transferase